MSLMIEKVGSGAYFKATFYRSESQSCVKDSHRGDVETQLCVKDSYRNKKYIVTEEHSPTEIRAKKWK